MLRLLDYRLRVSPPAVEARVQQLLAGVSSTVPDASPAAVGSNSAAAGAAAVNPVSASVAEVRMVAAPAASNPGSQTQAAAPLSFAAVARAAAQAVKPATPAAAVAASAPAVTRHARMPTVAPASSPVPAEAPTYPFAASDVCGLPVTAAYQTSAPSFATVAAQQPRVVAPGRPARISSGAGLPRPLPATAAPRLSDAIQAY